MRLGSTAADAPVKFQSDTTILTPDLALSRLCDILRPIDSITGWDIIDSLISHTVTVAV